MHWLAIVLIGGAVGFLGGLFGKGGSAIATPLLVAVGVPPLVALASPLPATVPGTLVAWWRYRRMELSDGSTVGWSLAGGVPAVVVGAWTTRWIDGSLLVAATEVLILGLGVRIVLRPRAHEAVGQVDRRRLRLVLVGAGVGLVSGLLANAGGFLLVPLYLAVVRLPIRSALAASLAVASVLAVPGTVVHAALGHIDWSVTLVFAAASIPLSSLGARTALRMEPVRLERLFGAGLAALGAGLLAVAR